MDQVITNGTDCKAKIIELISGARYDIKLAMAYFTDRDIASELIEAKHRGVNTSIILSDDSNNNEIANVLSQEQIVKTFESKGKGMMHHKFCIIDQKFLLHGSYNYTYNALKNNQESLSITDSYTQIKDYSSIYDALLNQIMSSTSNSSQYLDDTEPNYLQRFRDSLKNQISLIFDNFNSEEVTQEGTKLSKESDGSEAVFEVHLNSIVAEVNNVLNQNDHTKVMVKAGMTAALDNAIESNNRDFNSEIDLNSKHSSNQKNQLQLQIDTIRDRKQEVQKDFNLENSELSKLQSNISEIEDEIDHLDIQIVIRKFWTVPTYFKLFLLLILTMYLSVFFGSALWKIFFEESEIKALMINGITPDTPPLFDADALVKTFNLKGVFYGCVAMVFFLIPVLLSSIKLIVPNNKIIEYVIGWLVAIFAIDVVVSILISQQTSEINSLINGETNNWTIWHALTTGEFWLIFVFGALPVFLNKVLIENVWIAFNKSNPEFVDREKFILRNAAKRKLAQNKNCYEIVKLKMGELELILKDFNEDITRLEDQKNNIDEIENNRNFELQERFDRRINNLKEIYNSFVSSVDSGNKLFLENVVSGRINAFKGGFYLHLTSYYAPQVAQRKIENLESKYQTWSAQTFDR